MTSLARYTRVSFLLEEAIEKEVNNNNNNRKESLYCLHLQSIHIYLSAFP